MNKKEIDAWLKDLDKRDREAFANSEGDGDPTDYAEVTDYSSYHYVVVIPEDVYEQLEPDEQEKFSVCCLTDWMDDDFVVEDFGVEPDELNELWQRKFYDLHYGDNNDESKWTSLGNSNNGKPVNEVLVFNM